METKELVKQETNPNRLLELAVSNNLDIEKLERLLAMQERWEAKEAKKTFLRSLSAFQGEIPEIVKTKHVSFNNYNYAPLGEIAKQLKESVAKFGLSYRWQISDTEKQLTVTCIVSHESGHSEQTTMSAAPDDSGKKNQIQSRASTITYLQRYTLIGALGIATADEDKDGVKPPAEPSKQEMEQSMKRLAELKKEVEKLKTATEINVNAKDFGAKADKELLPHHSKELKDFIRKTYNEKKNETGNPSK